MGVNGRPGHISDNFYLVVADQGGCGGCTDCCAMQKQVAKKMDDYITARKAKNPNSELLFVLAGGDNFYWAGASSGRFSETWYDVYSQALTSVPWFSVFGNHDYGNSDPGIGCPSTNSRFTCDRSNMNSEACGGAVPYSTEPQGYNSNALNVNKGGVDHGVPNRANWHQPDYTYYYSIPALDFELVAMDLDFYQIGALGGNGPHLGASGVLAACGSMDALHNSLLAIAEASKKVLNNRSRTAASKNVAILGHYPDSFQGDLNLRNLYLQGMPVDKNKSTRVFNFFGHTHVQECKGQDANGRCVDFLTGGSGGCCGLGDVPAGFVALSFNGAREQITECFTTPECTIRPYAQPANSFSLSLNDIGQAQSTL